MFIHYSLSCVCVHVSLSCVCTCVCACACVHARVHTHTHVGHPLLGKGALFSVVSKSNEIPLEKTGFHFVNSYQSEIPPLLKMWTKVHFLSQCWNPMCKPCARYHSLWEFTCASVLLHLEDIAWNMYFTFIYFTNLNDMSFMLSYKDSFYISISETLEVID